MTTQPIDLVPQLGNIGLAGEELQFFTLQDTSPPRKKMRLWSKETGESWDFYEFRVPSLIATGRWTRSEAEVPQIVRSQYPCFLAPESEIREELDALGIVVRCNSKHPSRFAMEQVAAKKHPGSWKAWQAHIAEQERQADRERQERQVEAMMTLAQQGQRSVDALRTLPVETNTDGQRSVTLPDGDKVVLPETPGVQWSAPASVPCDVDGCDFEAKNAFGLQAHKRNKHGEVNDGT